MRGGSEGVFRLNSGGRRKNGVLGERLSAGAGGEWLSFVNFQGFCGVPPHDEGARIAGPFHADPEWIS
jgi:hypothetical protein